MRVLIRNNGETKFNTHLFEFVNEGEEYDKIFYLNPPFD